MRFYITLNMPSRGGNSIHQVIGDHEAKSLSELIDIMNDCDFIVVEEFYRNSGGELYSVGRVALNTMHIGKVKVSDK